MQYYIKICYNVLIALPWPAASLGKGMLQIPLQCTIIVSFWYLQKKPWASVLSLC